MQSIRNKLYYGVKGFIPQSVRLALRRRHASRIRQSVGAVWPIKPGSEIPPEGWQGWPDGKKFAVVLTHDVEGPEGLERVRQLKELEKSLGFRSAFYFVPEGSYEVPSQLREELVAEGFEVGVHDLYHDGKLYHSRRQFKLNAYKINEYLESWQATGFRSGFMHHNLDWIHDLNINYDASTFDTDPFEPQPDGVNTIFPFWVPRPDPTNEAPRTTHHAPHTTNDVQLTTNDVQRTNNQEPRTINKALSTTHQEPSTTNKPQAPSTINHAPSTKHQARFRLHRTPLHHATRFDLVPSTSGKKHRHLEDKA